MKSTVRLRLAAAALSGLLSVAASAQQKAESKPLDEPTILKGIRGPRVSTSPSSRRRPT